jgi:hypothetical protein
MVAWLMEQKRRAAFLIQRGNFAIEDDPLGRQQLQTVDQLRAIELSTASRARLWSRWNGSKHLASPAMEPTKLF